MTKIKERFAVMKPKMDTLKSIRSAVFLKKYAEVFTTGVVIASVTMPRPNLSPVKHNEFTLSAS